MTRLPTVTPKELITILLKLGFERRNQTGSHVRLVNRLTGRRTTIPLHSRELKRGTLHAILKQTGISPEDLTTFL